MKKFIFCSVCVCVFLKISAGNSFPSQEGPVLLEKSQDLNLYFNKKDNLYFNNSDNSLTIMEDMEDEKPSLRNKNHDLELKKTLTAFLNTFANTFYPQNFIYPVSDLTKDYFIDPQHLINARKKEMVHTYIEFMKSANEKNCAKYFMFFEKDVKKFENRKKIAKNWFEVMKDIEKKIKKFENWKVEFMDETIQSHTPYSVNFVYNITPNGKFVQEFQKKHPLGRPRIYKVNAILHLNETLDKIQKIEMTYD